MEDGLRSLVRHFLWADRLRSFFEEQLEEDDISEDPARVAHWFAGPGGLFMSYWFATMHVVIEGYRELGMTDENIDEHLKSANADLLRRFRNGVFHFQREYFDSRLINWFEPDTMPWLGHLHDEFDRLVAGLMLMDSGTTKP